MQPGSRLTQSSPGLPPVSIQWLKISQYCLKPSQPSPAPTPTTHYNSGPIPVPAPAAVAQKYQHLQEQTPSLSEHHHIPQDSCGEEGGRRRRAVGRMSTATVERKIINRERKEKINSLSMRERAQFTVYPGRLDTNCFSFF